MWPHLFVYILGIILQGISIIKKGVPATYLFRNVTFHFTEKNRHVCQLSVKIKVCSLCLNKYGDRTMLFTQVTAVSIGN